ncbi:hypothetical protein [Streptomyces olivochromogenes]|uniref:hypothetical protein n=1 Tax=Streptomyces olivochromogenes TaxID=1963 RepID=UPI001F1CD5D6|nr:hypothetical protein [Streptomyces olivochromogenes]MCF3137520.1 hypothetical protein [Streptomyces olivochromogenes]
MSTAQASCGTPVLSALEAFYARDIDDLAAWGRATFDEARAKGLDDIATIEALRVDAFMSVYLEQIHSVPAERWAASLPMPEGHLRSALLGRELVDVPRTGRLNVLMDGRLYGAERLPSRLSADYRELKAPLCYAHDVLFEDPFDDEHHALVQMRVIQESSPDTVMRPVLEPGLFVRTLRTLADLAPLIRAGTVMFIPRQLTADPRSIAMAGSSIAGLGGAVSRQELAERTVRAWLLTGGRAVPLFADADEEAAFREAAALLAPLLPEREGGFMSAWPPSPCRTAGGSTPGTCWRSGRSRCSASSGPGSARPSPSWATARTPRRCGCTGRRCGPPPTRPTAAAAAG